MPFPHASLVSYLFFYFLLFFPLSHLFNFVFVIVCQVSERRLALNCCSDLTPTQASKSREAIVGIWTTSAIPRQIFFLAFFIPCILIFFTLYDYSFYIILFLMQTSFPCFFFFTLSHILHLICLSVCLSVCVSPSSLPLPLPLVIDLSG